MKRIQWDVTYEIRLERDPDFCSGFFSSHSERSQHVASCKLTCCKLPYEDAHTTENRNWPLANTQQGSEAQFNAHKELNPGSRSSH
jgi:hypothetical protein